MTKGPFAKALVSTGKRRLKFSCMVQEWVYAHTPPPPAPGSVTTNKWYNWKSTRKWAAPIVPRLKDNTVRICGDYKVTVNSVKVRSVSDSKH